ncbi:uncharacterized protein METZ01_LOCUS427133, partial [marine metagenome]
VTPQTLIFIFSKLAFKYGAGNCNYRGRAKVEKGYCC